jgi:hypothetical protein
MASKISTRNLSLLPGISELRRLCQSVAMLDAILSPLSNDRRFYFDCHWVEKEMMAFMSQEEGDEYCILFNSHGAIIKGWRHSAAMAKPVIERGHIWPGVLSDVPKEFARFLITPAFMMERTTFCLWRLHSDDNWHTGNIEFPEGDDPDGSESLLFMLDGDPQTFANWSRQYNGRDTPVSLIKRIYEFEPLTSELVEVLDSPITFDDLGRDLEDIGYPVRLS